MQTWAKFHGMVHLGRILQKFGCPTAGAKIHNFMAKQCAVHFVSICSSFLFSFGASFVVFHILEFSLSWFFTLIAFNKKLIQSHTTESSDDFLAGKNKLHHRKVHVHKMNCFLDRSQSLVCCFDSGPWVASFVRTWHDMLLLLFILFTNKTLHHLGFGMFTVGTAIFHWLYFDSIVNYM